MAKLDNRDKVAKRDRVCLTLKPESELKQHHLGGS